MQNDSINLTTAQSIFLGMYSLLVILVGLIGNATVIYTSLKHNAIKLDCVILTFIQNLAVADILYITVVVIPSFITTSTGAWVFGQLLCDVFAQLKIIPAMANTIFVLAITIQRLVLFTCPFRGCSARAAKIWAGCIWGGIILFLLPFVVYYKPRGEVVLGIGMCLTTLHTIAKVAALFTTALTVLLPMVLIIITNIIICVIANKHSSVDSRIKRRRQGNNILLISLISGVFILSWILYIIRNLLPVKYDTLDLVAFNCLAINSCANPILYSLTNLRFRKYLIKRLNDFKNIFECRSWKEYSSAMSTTTSL